MSVEETLARLESLNAKAVQHNKREVEINGSKKARIQNILREVEILNSLGYSLKMELASETEFTKGSIDAFKTLLAEVTSKKEEEANRLEAFFKAVENKDYDAIKELTGEDVSIVSYDVEVTDSKSVKEEAKEVSAQLLENDSVVEIAEGTSPLIKEEVKEVKPKETPTSEPVSLTKQEEQAPSSDAASFLESALNGSSTKVVENVSVEVPVEVTETVEPTKTSEVVTETIPKEPVNEVPSAFAGFNFTGSDDSTGSWADNFKL